MPSLRGWRRQWILLVAVGDVVGGEEEEEGIFFAAFGVQGLENAAGLVEHDDGLVVVFVQHGGLSVFMQLVYQDWYLVYSPRMSALLSLRDTEASSIVA
jgi:hypothetical protein